MWTYLDISGQPPTATATGSTFRVWAKISTVLDEILKADFTVHGKRSGDQVVRACRSSSASTLTTLKSSPFFEEAPCAPCETIGCTSVGGCGQQDSALLEMLLASAILLVSRGS